MTSRSTSRERPGTSRRTFTLGIWALALGYFAFYAPYAALVRIISTGAPPAIDGLHFRVGMLLAAGLMTAAVMALTITALGWWRYPGQQEILGVRVRWPRRRTILPGLATVAIIYATTLMYTFSGVSILLAMLLMRGGVLMMAPVVDRLFERHVRWFSWTAFGLSLLALAAVAAELPSYQLTGALGATISVYIGAYAIRLHCINAVAKSRDREATCRYFVEEQMVAMGALALMPAALGLIGASGLSPEVRDGFTSFLSTTAFWPSMLIGLLYASLYWFGTSIYLDRRENTFCISLNRCSSVLAAVAASYAVALLFGRAQPNTGELTGAGLILTAMAVLSPLHHLRVGRVRADEPVSSGWVVSVRSPSTSVHYAISTAEK